MQDNNQNPPEVNAGAASEDDIRRKLMLEVEDALNNKDDLDDDEKKGLLERLNLSTMIELEKTRQDLAKEGQAAREDQEKQEKGNE